MKFNSLLLALLLVVARVAVAQNGGELPAPPPAALPAPAAAAPCAVLSGRVTAGGQSLAGASITIKDTRIVLITNQDGFFTTPTSLAEAPMLFVTASGYAPQTLTPTGCTPVAVEMQMLPGVRVKRRGRRKGYILIKNKSKLPVAAPSPAPAPAGAQ